LAGFFDPITTVWRLSYLKDGITKTLLSVYIFVYIYIHLITYNNTRPYILIYTASTEHLSLIIVIVYVTRIIYRFSVSAVYNMTNLNYTIAVLTKMYLKY